MRFAICNLVLLIAVLGCDDRKSTVAATKVIAAGTASVHGKVSFGGTVAPPVVIDKGGLCSHGEPLVDETVVVGEDRGLANVVVYIGGVSSSNPPPGEPVVLDQKDCRYVPHVLAMRAGQVLRIRSSDAEVHNVHSFSSDNPAFNVAMAKAGAEKDVLLQRPETFRVKCDVHPWMTGYVAVMTSNFFAVTKDDGGFEIKGLPPGSYELVAWHERFGELKQTVEVKDDAVTVNLVYRASN